jgi:low affinity Fe/Cu permease
MTFDNLARRVSHASGHAMAFVAALTIIVVWAAIGPIVGFSDVWQLVINTGTTIVTFLLVFILQNTQNRDSLAIHAKLDALIDATADADDALERIEEASTSEIETTRDVSTGRG